jgi:hypothetical protein
MVIVGPFALVAIAAKALQRTEAEGVPIAAMERIMVSDRRRREVVGLEAGGAQRLDPELMTSALPPTL